MESQSVIGIYTALQGWRLYGVIWDVLTGSGLALLPVIGIVFDSIQQSRSRGSMLSADADSSISHLEVGLFRMLFVIAIAFIPTSLTTLDKDSFVSNGDTAEENNTSYKDSYGSELEIVGTSVNIPIWWWFTMGVSNGITKAVASDVSTNTAYNDLEVSLRNGVIQNPITRYKTQIFTKECYSEARHIHFTSLVSVSPEIDIDWIGSNYLYNNYYNGISTKTLLPGYAYDAKLMPEYSQSTGNVGRVICKKLWDDLRTAIYAEAEAQGTVKFYEAAWAAPSAETKNSIVRRYIMNTPINKFISPDEALSIIEQGDGSGISGVIEWFGNQATNIGIGSAVFLLSSATDSILIAAEIMQAYILMFLYMSIPIAMLVSGFSLGFLIQGALVIFSVTFWTALFSIVAHADTFISQSLFGAVSNNVLDTIINPREVSKSLVHSLVVLGMYITVPGAATWMLSAAGSQAAMALNAVTSAQSATTGGVQASSKGAAVAATGIAGKSASGIVRQIRKE